MEESKGRVPPPTPEEIAQRAYALFEARGGAAGSELQDWTTAERQLRAERELRGGPKPLAKPKHSRPRKSAAPAKGAESSR